MARILLTITALLLLLAVSVYGNMLMMGTGKHVGSDGTTVFNVTDNGGEAFVVTDNGGENYNVRE